MILKQLAQNYLSFADTQQKVEVQFKSHSPARNDEYYNDLTQNHINIQEQ